MKEQQMDVFKTKISNQIYNKPNLKSEPTQPHKNRPDDLRPSVVLCLPKIPEKSRFIYWEMGVPTTPGIYLLPIG